MEIIIPCTGTTQGIFTDTFDAHLHGEMGITISIGDTWRTISMVSGVRINCVHKKGEKGHGKA